MDYITPQEQSAKKREVNIVERQHHITPVNSPLYVITAISNPSRYYSRYKLYQAFEKHVNESGAILYTIELAVRDRHFEVTQHDDPKDIQLRSPSILWSKEKLINLAVQRLPEDWQYFCWVDGDIRFLRSDWAYETLQLLQIYKVVQMFSHAIDLSPDFEPIQTQTGFMYSWIKNHLQPTRINTENRNGYPYYGHKLWHSGYCMAFRRSAFSDLGGLGDIAILGSSDHHMACALIGRVMESIHGGMSKGFKDYWKEWENRATRSIKRNIGYMPGTIAHYWHGKKKDRGYMDRWKILVEEHFDPFLDLKLDPQGLWTLTDRNSQLRDRVREYFSSRNEDSIDIN